jgi:hypothetical protein
MPVSVNVASARTRVTKRSLFRHSLMKITETKPRNERKRLSDAFWRGWLSTFDLSGQSFITMSAAIAPALIAIPSILSAFFSRKK